jgi:hypothetical protein
VKDLSKMRPFELVAEIQRLKAMCARAADALDQHEDDEIGMHFNEPDCPKCLLIVELRKVAG